MTEVLEPSVVCRCKEYCSWADEERKITQKLVMSVEVQRKLMAPKLRLKYSSKVYWERAWCRMDWK